MKPLLALACLFLTVATECLAQNGKTPRTREWREMINTEITGPNCKPVLDDSDARLCKGVEGYSLLVKGDEQKPQVFVVTPNGQQFPMDYWNTADPRYQSLWTTVTWIVVYKPKTISVTFSPRVAQKQDYTYSDSYDTIARIWPEPVCIVGSVPVGSTSAMVSNSIATSPATLPCLSFGQYEKRDWFLTARRLASEGKVQEAQSALEHLKEPSERFIVYREISNAQFKAGES